MSELYTISEEDRMHLIEGVKNNSISDRSVSITNRIYRTVSPSELLKGDCFDDDHLKELLQSASFVRFFAGASEPLIF